LQRIFDLAYSTAIDLVNMLIAAFVDE